MKSDWFVNQLLWARMQALRWTHWRPFVADARRPWETQQRVLLDIVRRNCDTRFGREHGFDKISCYKDFAAAVPVQDYESLRPYIEEQEGTGEPALNAERPVMYAQTSGTTGKPKLIPILARSLNQLKRSQSIQSFVQFSAVPQTFYGRILGITSPAVEGTLESGTPYGSASGHISKNISSESPVRRSRERWNRGRRTVRLPGTSPRTCRPSQRRSTFYRTRFLASRTMS